CGNRSDNHLGMLSPQKLGGKQNDDLVKWHPKPAADLVSLMWGALGSGQEPVVVDRVRNIEDSALLNPQRPVVRAVRRANRQEAVNEPVDQRQDEVSNALATGAAGQREMRFRSHQHWQTSGLGCGEGDDAGQIVVAVEPDDIVFPAPNLRPQLRAPQRPEAPRRVAPITGPGENERVAVKQIDIPTDGPSKARIQAGAQAEVTAVE